MKNTRIALVCDWYLPEIGGIELHLRDLARELRALGHDVTIVTTTQSTRSEEEEGLQVRRLSFPRMAGVALPDLRRIREIAALLERERIELVHAHGMFSTLAIGSLVAAQRLGIPSVLTHHSMIGGLKVSAARAIYRIWSHRATRVTAVSAAAARDARRVSGRDDVIILPNGIDPSRWAREPGLAPASDEEPVFRIASVGRLVAGRRPMDLLRVIPEILARVKYRATVRVAFVGDGPLRARLEAAAARLAVAEHVEFCGNRPREAVRDILMRSHLYVSMCRTEAFGLALLEARCAGVPVVALNAGGAGEVVEHGVSGLLASSPEGVIRHVVRLIEDGPLRRRMAVVRSDVDRFRWAMVVPQHLAVYEGAVERTRA